MKRFVKPLGAILATVLLGGTGYLATEHGVDVPIVAAAEAECCNQVDALADRVRENELALARAVGVAERLEGVLRQLVALSADVRELRAVILAGRG